jgi:hypothetical protein
MKGRQLFLRGLCRLFASHKNGHKGWVSCQITHWGDWSGTTTKIHTAHHHHEKEIAAFAACASALTLDLPTMMMLQGGMGGSTDMFSNPLLMMTLLDSESSDGSTSSLDDILPFMLMNGGAMDMNSMLPFLLMKDGAMDDDLLLMMMMGGMNLGGGAAPIAPMGDLAANPALMSVLMGRK